MISQDSVIWAMESSSQAEWLRRVPGKKASPFKNLNHESYFLTKRWGGLESEPQLEQRQPSKIECALKDRVSLRRQEKGTRSVKR
jgi:hypothetical protein